MKGGVQIQRLALGLSLLVCAAVWSSAAMASSVQGDFNGDGFADLAVGVPGEDVETIVDAGAVNVIYGTATGLAAANNDFWHQNVTGVNDVAETGDEFGRALAAGDFNGDGFSDLAVGVPLEDVGTVEDAGAVTVLYGSATGLVARRDRFLHQNSAGILDAAEEADEFGYSLAAANFGKSRMADLAVGVQREDVGTVSEAGAVNLIYGSRAGLSDAGDQFWHQNRPGIADLAEEGDAFGRSLAAGNFGKSPQADLAIGIYTEGVGSAGGAGAVSVIYGSARGLSSTGDQFWHQDSSGIAGTADPGDLFGWSVAAANFGKSAYADLAVGVPDEDLGTSGNAGAVNVLYGRSTGLSARGDQLWYQGNNGIEDTAEAFDFFGGDLAAANFGKSRYSDLAITVVEEDVGEPAVPEAGAVSVIYGSSTGLSGNGDQLWYQGFNGSEDTAEEFDYFGESVAAANFGKSGFADLAVGVDFEDVGTVTDAGAVNVFYGTSTGLSGTGDQFWSQDSTGIADAAETDDNFGWALGPRR